jgi:hypothetical protein
MREFRTSLARYLTPALLLAFLSTAVSPLAAQAPTPPKATDVLVMMTVKPGVQREQIGKLAPVEIRAAVRLYLDGKIRQWFQRTDGLGIVFIVPVEDITEAQAIMETLPLAQAHLVDLQYFALSPLGPLGTLLGPPPADR